MKILAISDPHFHPFQQFADIKGGISTRVLDVARTFDAAVDYGVEQGCELMVIPGDIFHTRGAIKPSVLNVVINCFERAMSRFPVVMIPGNHDMEDFKGGATAIDFLRIFPNVYVMGKPSTLTIRDLKICGIPYQHNLKAFEEAVASVKYANKCDLFLIHQGIDDLADPGVPATGLTVKKLHGLFGKKKPILCGHYHRPGGTKNITQVGAPLQHNFGDEGQDRGCWLIETEPAGTTSIFYPLNAAPRFRTIAPDTFLGSVSVDDFIRVKASSAEEAKTVVDTIGAKSFTVAIEREYSSVHGTPVKVGSVEEMLQQYFEISGTPKEEAGEALALYSEVCK